MAQKVDVLICGSGSAGLCAAVWLARCGINYRILERRPGPLENGQADGVQCRTVEIFESFGMSEDLLKEAYHVLEIAFWASDGNRGVRRTHYAPDLEPGLSHQPHVILNQARINGLMIEDIVKSSGSAAIDYAVDVKSVEVDSAVADDPEAYCVTTTAVSNGIEQVFHSKYVLACDGAHSAVRKSLGFKMVGDSTDAVWGVMDVHVRTTFPDIRKKAILHSDSGNLMIIPREGDSMVRFYIELVNVVDKDVSLEQLQEQARRIFSPYSMEIVETVWWSAYAIGQRLADSFTKDNRVFLTGDACHTHSPKAGQGMNVSLQDGYNIGWKLAAVLRKKALPDILQTYVSERQKTATELVEFDRSWAKLFSSTYRQRHGITPEHFKDHFVKAGRYTAGQGVSYNESLLVASTVEQSVATGIVVGMRFPSAQVVRFCDARAMQLVRALPADSRWHIVVFSGDILDQDAATRLDKLSKELSSVVRKFTPSDGDSDSIIQSLLVLASKRTEVEQEQVPDLFTPISGKWGSKCLQKVFVDDESYNSGHGHAYKAYGIDPKHGGLVVVRPDHYVAMVTSLQEIDRVSAFFDNFLLPATRN
ncbi:FAD binding domain-containing protein [Dactylonectria macrodidyma]|uniref:FAD binding domain-containing protein n=1 Tax=Dactylonectria macrodidyma TaxID=307937 RepID=A0A9P9F1R5_9HYPO|nr:FAD binding domain-containing protein [Dactylonectria macrodidyma]